MPPTIAELLEALPYDPAEDSAAEHALESMLNASRDRPVPTGRSRRALTLSTLQGRIAAAYFAWWLRKFFRNTDERAATLNETHLRNAIRLLDGMGYLRGAVMKVGQILSSWPDIVPTEFADVLGRLQFQAPPMHFELLREFVYRELGDDPENLFDDFKTEAFAAASLGQVHRARLTGTNRDVAVKIQYPNIARTIRDDVRNMKAITWPMQLGRDGDHLKRQLEEVRRKLEEEVDYEHEARTLDLGRSVFTDGDDIIVPRVIEERSTSRVLTMDFIEGVHPPQFLETNPSQDDRDRFGSLMVRATMRLWYHAHLCYSDVHPGNFIWTPDRRLGLIDFGCCHRFSPADIDYLTEVEQTIGSTDEEQIQRALLRSVDLERPDDPRRMELLRAYCEWLVTPMMDEGPFDFGDRAYFQRGMEIYGEIMKRRYIRSLTVNTWVGRIFIGLRALLTQLEARVDYGGILREETTMA